MMHVAYCCDTDYRRPMYASLTSLLSACEEPGRITVHVVTDRTTNQCRRDLDRLAERFGTAIYPLEFPAEQLQVMQALPARLNLPSMLQPWRWARVFLPELLPASVDRVLYLDCDTIILADVLALNEQHMFGAPIAAAPCYSDSWMSRKLGIACYINTGVMLIDRDQWRTRGLTQTVLENAEASPVTYAEQCAVNRTFAGSLHMLDRAWNTYVTPATQPKDLEGAKILHFITPSKPWHPDYKGPMAWRYFNALQSAFERA